MNGLILERDGSVARVTLERPPLNILTPALIAALGEALRGLAGDGSVRVAVLAATGRAFSAMQAFLDGRAARGSA